MLFGYEDKKISLCLDPDIRIAFTNLKSLIFGP